MKKGVGVLVLVFLSVILLTGFVSAGWWSDFFAKITGNVISSADYTYNYNTDIVASSSKTFFLTSPVSVSNVTSVKIYWTDGGTDCADIITINGVSSTKRDVASPETETFTGNFGTVSNITISTNGCGGGKTKVYSITVIGSAVSGIPEIPVISVASGKDYLSVYNRNIAASSSSIFTLISPPLLSNVTSVKIYWTDGGAGCKDLILVNGISSGARDVASPETETFTGNFGTVSNITISTNGCGGGKTKVYSIIVTGINDSTLVSPAVSVASPVTPIPPVICTDFSYSDWSICSFSGSQTRTIVSSSPSGCEGGSLVLSEDCTYIPSCDNGICDVGETPESCSADCSRLFNVRDFGAKADGKTDDTAAINSAINNASLVTGSLNRATVYFPNGTYKINAVKSIYLKINVNLYLEKNATLTAITNNAKNYAIFLLFNVSNISIAGGTLLGERWSHTGNTGEWGMGIQIFNSEFISISNITIKNCWGDGIYLGDAFHNAKNPDSNNNIAISNFFLDSNRRQGISIIDGKNIIIRDGVISNTGGTAPSAGIDFEPNDNGYEIIRNATVINLTTKKNAGSGIILSDNNYYSGVFANITKHVSISDNGALFYHKAMGHVFYNGRWVLACDWNNICEPSFGETRTTCSHDCK